MKKSPLPVQNICGPEKQKIGKEALVKLLRWHFGHSEFRGKQLEAIEAVLSGSFSYSLLVLWSAHSKLVEFPSFVFLYTGLLKVSCDLKYSNLIIQLF